MPNVTQKRDLQFNALNPKLMKLDDIVAHQSTPTKAMIASSKSPKPNSYLVNYSQMSSIMSSKSPSANKMKNMQKQIGDLQIRKSIDDNLQKESF